MVPAAVGVLAVIANTLEYSVGHTPLLSCALYHVLACMFVNVWGCVLALSTSENPVLADVVDACHWIVPAEPVSLSGLSLPLQTVKPDVLSTAATPATAFELTVTVIGVAVEQHGGTAGREAGQPPFARLRPPGVIDLGIHIRPEPVLGRILHRPRDRYRRCR